MSQIPDDHTGRQDLAAPAPTLEKTDSTPVDVGRGQRLWLYIAIVAVIFVAVVIFGIATR